jgi:heat shock protein HslJ
VRSLVLLAAVVVLLGACGDSEPAADSSAPTTAPATTTAPASAVTVPPPALDGHEYVSTDVTGDDLVAGSEIRLTFDGGNLGANAGCNQLGGTWSLEGDVLVVPENMVMTEMACAPALMEQDSWLAEFLSSRPTVDVADDTLTLSGGDVTITLVDREVADRDRPLEGTHWELDSLVSADAVSSVATERMPSLKFEHGEVMVETGCNSGSGSYELAQQEITFGPIATTRMACDEPTMEVEAHVLNVLQGTVSYAIEADVLTLSNGDLGLTYRAAE